MRTNGPQADDQLHPADLVDNKETTVVASDRAQPSGPGEWPVSTACSSDPVLSARAQKISRRAYWLSDPDLRQHSHAGLNKGEASNSVRRAVFFHHQGEIRDRPDQQARHPDNQIIGRAKKITWNRPSVRAGLGRAATPPHRGPPLPRTRAPRSARKLARRQA